ncbi:ABC transporter permease [Leptolyngbya sp. 7M]|uniref:ABC transporter permease n=1 Tax=Leptolyngbya sp. 7M TaxID=2812896 RepID=UPI001B8A8ED6|nr:ABC transporter permease [Leptolyngbya sp. 7M]QYO67354.1 ABC transporter permease [Leptolyngbya sp. 7M]
MVDLIVANLRVRPFRTLISVIGVALGVVLVVLFTGLARGMTNDMARRAANWKAEIVFTRSGAMGLDSSNMSVSTGYVPRLLEIPGVAMAVPVGRYVTPDTRGRWGLQQIDGVDWEPFAAMNEMKIVEGRRHSAESEVIFDERQMREDNAKLGDTITLFGGRQYTIVGVFSPPSGSRIKMSLAALQSALEAPDRCTYILVKIANDEDAEAVAARINEALPGNKVNLTRDLVIDAQQRVPALNTFLRVLVGLGAFVSTIFVLLSMYTTVTERRKEIGILKSLGASKSFIIRAIEGEAFLIGTLGVILGVATAYLASELIWRVFELHFEFSLGWIITAVTIAIIGSLIGALYPAWKASAIDPVEVMTNE